MAASRLERSSWPEPQANRLQVVAKSESQPKQEWRERIAEDRKAFAGDGPKTRLGGICGAP